MNPCQAAFYRQARSDWLVFAHFRAMRRRRDLLMRVCRAVARLVPDFAVCHDLHYLQMATEKLSKAYYQTPIPKHAAFRIFLRDLPQNPRAVRPLGFATVADLTRWAGSVKPIVDAVEDLAPAIADPKALPNPEYPWPKASPMAAPVDYPFTVEIFSLLDAQARSGEPPFLAVLEKMVLTMQSVAWHL